MKLTSAVWPFLGIITLFLAHPGLMLQLQPLLPNTLLSSQLHAREFDYSALEIQNTETFLWSGTQHGRTAFANFTVYMPAEGEGIINMEQFHSLIGSVHCSNKNMSLQFKDDAAFKYAVQNWDSVNDAVNHTLLLVAGAGQCGFNGYRMPFLVSSVVPEVVTNTVTLLGSVMPWKAVAHTYDLHVGRIPPELANSMKRDYDKYFTLGFNNPMPFSSWTFPADGFSLTWNCNSCGTFGEFIFDFHIHTEFEIPIGASLIISPKGVSAAFNPQVGISGNFTDSKSDEITFLTIPIDGISIDDFLDFGPALVFSGGYSIGPVKGSATIGTGVTVSLEDSAELTIDLLSPDFSASGWTPQVSEQPVQLSAQISAAAQLFLKAAVDFELSVFDLGFEVGVDLKPFAGVSISTIDSDTGACSNDPEHHQFGAKLAPSAGVALEADAAWADNTASPFAQVTIASATMDLPTACIGFGQPATTTPITTKIPSSSSPVVSPVPPQSSSAARPPPPPPASSSPARPPPPPPASSSARPPPPSSSSRPPPPPSSSVTRSHPHQPPPASSSAVPPPPPSSTSTSTTKAPPPPPPSSSAAAINHNILHRKRHARDEMHH